MYGLYGALLGLAWVAVLPYETVLALLTRKPRARLGERLGFVGDAPRPGGIWVHAVSVGEVRLALTLVGRLRERYPGLGMHLTTGTETGRALAEGAREVPGNGYPDSVSALPIDLPGPMGRLLDLLRPRAILIVETEIWPNLLRLGHRRGIPILLINGRISPRSYPRYRAFARFMGRALEGVRLFAMQSEEDAARIRSLGARSDRVRVTGNLKFDLPVTGVDGGDMRRRLGVDPEAPLFVAGSTAPGEEGPVLEAFAVLRREVPSARLIVAPRHPRDLPRALAALAAGGLRVAAWSRLAAAGGRPGDGPAPHDALLIDVVGVLPAIYAAADLVFVGGSLVERGGHNILEPAALGKPVLFGPHMQNFAAAAQALTDAGAGFVARDGKDLGNLAVRLLSDRAAYRVASASARAVVEANRGAMERTLGLIAGFLPHAGMGGPAGALVAGPP